jgi:hypothetical protein
MKKNISISLLFLSFLFGGMATVEAAADEETLSASFSEVADETTLDQYVSLILETDDDASAASASTEGVSLRYKQPAKLLGFIPFSMSVAASVLADGTIVIKEPWYSLLVRYDDSRLVSNLKVLAKPFEGSEFDSAAQAASLMVTREVMRGFVMGRDMLEEIGGR